MTGRDLTSARVRGIGESAIHKMTRMAKKYDDVAFLSWAKPTSETPEHIRKAAADAIMSGKVGGYSESSGMLELRESIAAKVRTRNGIDAEPSQILVTVGAVEGLTAAVLATVDPGDEVILPSPTYPTYIDIVRLASAVPVLVPTLEDEGFALDLDAIEKAITGRTKAIMYCSPNNPTGAVFGERKLRGLADIALAHDLVIITDEAYEYFTFDGTPHVSIASLKDAAPNTISCFTLTKNYAMTGWRIGYLHAPGELMPQILKAHNPLAICAPVVSQHAALAALKGPQDCIDTFREEYLSARNLMCRRLDAMGSVFSYQRPMGSYLMFPKVLDRRGRDSTALCMDLVEKARVSATPGAAFGPTGEGHIRLSFCVPEDMINTAFDRMERYFGV